MLLVNRVRLSTSPILNLTYPLIFRSTRRVVGCVGTVRDIADKYLRKCRRKPRGLGFDDATMKVLLLPDYMMAVLGTGEGHPIGLG